MECKGTFLIALPFTLYIAPLHHSILVNLSATREKSVRDLKILIVFNSLFERPCMRDCCRLQTFAVDWLPWKYNFTNMRPTELKILEVKILVGKNICSIIKKNWKRISRKKVVWKYYNEVSEKFVRKIIFEFMDKSKEIFTNSNFELQWVLKFIPTYVFMQPYMWACKTFKNE